MVDVSEELAGEETVVQANIELATRILSSNNEPDIDLSESCRSRAAGTTTEAVRSVEASLGSILHRCLVWGNGIE